MNEIDALNAWNLSRFDIENNDPRTPEQIEKERLERLRLNEVFKNSGRRYYDSSHKIHYAQFNQVSYLSDGTFSNGTKNSSDIMYYNENPNNAIHLDYYVRSAKKLGLTVQQAAQASRRGAESGSGKIRDNMVREFRDKNFGTNEQEQYTINRKLAKKVTFASYASMPASEKAYYDNMPNVVNYAKQASDEAGRIEDIATELREVELKKRLIQENKIIEANRIIEKERIEKENKIIEEKRIKDEKEKQEEIKNDLEAQQNSFIEPIFKDENIIKTDMGKPKSVFNTQEENIVPEIVTPVERTDKPESVFNENEFSENQTSIADITEDLSAQLENFIDTRPELKILDDSYLHDNIFKNDETEIKNVTFEITPINFKIQAGRITGTVNVSSSELTKEKPVLHASFFPLDMKQNKLSEKINQLNFNKDLNETIPINESSKTYQNVSMNLHVMNPKTKEHLSQEVNIDVLETDTQDMPVKEKKDNTSLYVVGGIGLIVLALIVKKMRKGDKV